MDVDRNSPPLFALQGLYAPTVFYAFIFFSRQEKSKTTNTAYVYTWTRLLSDECFVSLWNIPHFTLCTSLNKVYEFIALCRDAAESSHSRLCFIEYTKIKKKKKHFLVLAVVVAWYKLLCEEIHKNIIGKCATKFLILKGTKYNWMYLYHVDYYSIYCALYRPKLSTKGEVGYAAPSGSLIIKIMFLRWWWLGFKGLCKLINLW